jgi:hypothetical protein
MGASPHSKLNGHQSMPDLFRSGSNSRQKRLQGASKDGVNGFITDSTDASSTRNGPGSHREVDSENGTAQYGGYMSDGSEGTDESVVTASPRQAQAFHCSSMDQQKASSPVFIAGSGPTYSCEMESDESQESRDGSSSAGLRGGGSRMFSSTSPVSQHTPEEKPLASMPGTNGRASSAKSSASTVSPKSGPSESPESVIGHDGARNRPLMRVKLAPKLAKGTSQPVSTPAGPHQLPPQRLSPPAVGDPLPLGRSGVQPSSKPMPGGLLLPVEVPLAAQQPASMAPASSVVPSAFVPLGAEPLRALSMPHSGRTWSEEGSWPQNKLPKHGQAQDGSNGQGGLRHGQTGGHGAAGLQRREVGAMDRFAAAQPHMMRMPLSGAMPSTAALSLPGFHAEPRLHRAWQPVPVTLAGPTGRVDPVFLNELQHQMLLHSNQQQWAMFPQSREQRAPMRTRSLPKLQEQPRLQNGRVSPGADHWHAPARHSSSKVGVSHSDDREAPAPGKQQHMEAFMQLPPVMTGRMRQDQSQAAVHPRGHVPLQRQGYSLPTTPVTGGQHRGFFPMTSAPVHVKRPEGTSMWMSAADAMQLALAQQGSMSVGAAIAESAPCTEEQGKGQDAGADVLLPPPPPPPRSISGGMQRQQSSQVGPYMPLKALKVHPLASAMILWKRHVQVCTGYAEMHCQF